MRKESDRKVAIIVVYSLHDKKFDNHRTTVIHMHTPTIAKMFFKIIHSEREGYSVCVCVRKRKNFIVLLVVFVLVFVFVFV